MKKYLWAAMTVSALVSYNSCTKDVALKPEAIVCSSIDSSANTYTLKIKSILDSHCTDSGCHDAVFASDGINLTTYADAKSAFESGEVMGAVMHEQGFIAMPQNKPKLADSLIAYLQCWKNNNYPQ